MNSIHRMMIVSPISSIVVERRECLVSNWDRLWSFIMNVQNAIDCLFMLRIIFSRCDDKVNNCIEFRLYFESYLKNEKYSLKT
jgi:hypothetical protein